MEEVMRKERKSIVMFLLLFSFGIGLKVQPVSAFTFQGSSFLKNNHRSSSLRSIPKRQRLLLHSKSNQNDQYSSSHKSSSRHHTHKKKNKKPLQRRRSSSTTTLSPSPVLTPITTEDDHINQQRLRDLFVCKHIEKCAGCTTDKNVANIDIVESSKLYFGSSYIRKYYNSKQNSDFDYNNANDEFYKVIIPSELTKWRTQAKLAVARKSKWGRDGCIFGLYERNSHRVLPIADCSVHHPSINRAVELLKVATTNVNTIPFDEEGDGKRNGLRYIQCQVERSTNKISLTLVWDAGTIKECQPGLSRLVKELKRLDSNLWLNIWCHTNNSSGNLIFARAGGERRWHNLAGPEFLRESIPGAKPDKKEGLLHFTPNVFRQANMDGFETIALHVAKAIPSGSKVCELYAGVGLLGFTALLYHHNNQRHDVHDNDNDREWWDEESSFPKEKTCGNEPLKWVRCSDENPANLQCFKRTVNTMQQEVTGIKPRVNKKFKNKYNGRRNNNHRNLEGPGGKILTIQEMLKQMNDEASHEPSSGKSDENEEKVTYMVASAAKALKAGQALGANVLVVGPPRKGLGEEVLFELCKPHNPKQIYSEDHHMIPPNEHTRHSINLVNDVETLVYVSCGFDALARDCDRLLKGKSGWKIVSATGYVLFPGSNHVETVLVLKRNFKQRYTS